MPSDPYRLQRLLDAQASVYDQVCVELASGRKTGHWMWFVFPQLAGLGFSAMSRRYAITGPDEATAYLDHPTLGARLRECTSIVVGLRDVSADRLFGQPDTLKFQSCMTLFSRVGHEPIFDDALRRFYDGEPDQATVRLLLTSRRPDEWNPSAK